MTGGGSGLGHHVSVTGVSRRAAPPAARLLALVALAWGAAWLVWRVAVSGRGAAPALFAALLVVEAAFWVRLALFTAVAWAPPRQRPPPTGRSWAVDVVVVGSGVPAEAVRSTLLGCRAVAYPHRTVLVDDAERPALVEAALATGTRYVVTAGPVRSRVGALAAAMAVTDGELILVLDGGQVPMPDALHALVDWFEDAEVALVQTPVGHDDGDTGRAVDAEALGPARSASGAAFWTGGGAVLRRDAVADVGGLTVGSVVGNGAAETATSVRLHADGWRVVRDGAGLVRWPAPRTLAGFLAERAERAGAALAALRTRPRLLLDRRLSGRQRLVHLQVVWEQLTGLWRLALAVVALVVVLTGRLPLNGPPVALVALWLPAWVLGGLAARAMVRGRLGAGDIVRRDLIVLQVQLSALGALVRPRAPSPAPGPGPERGGLDAVAALPLLAVLTVALQAGVALRLVDALIGRPLPPMSGWGLVLTLLGCGYLAWQGVETLGVFVNRRQRRARPRVSVDQPARCDGELVRVVDLSPSGVAFVSTDPLPVGAEVTLHLSVTDLDGRPRPVTATATVVSGLPNRDGSRFRIGAALSGLHPADRDVLTEYWAVVRPFQLRG